MRRQKLLNGQGLSYAGNGTLTPCVWCGVLLGNRGGHLDIILPGGARIRLKVYRLELDRVRGLGSPYRMDNLVPACPDCNKARTYDEFVVPEGCEFGPEVAAQRRAHLEAVAAGDVIELEPFIESAPEDELGEAVG